MENKKIGKKLIYISLILILTGIIVLFNNSYAYFEEEINGDCVTLEVGKLIHSLNSDIKLAVGESRKVDVLVKNNEDIASKYQIYYTSESDLTNVIVGYSSDSANPASGDIEVSEKKSVTIVLQNNSDSEVTVEIGVRGGLVTNAVEDIILEDGEYRVEELVNVDETTIKSPSELYAFYKGTFTATATSSEVLSGKTVYINGIETVGTMPNNGELNWNPSDATTYTLPAGYYSGGTISTENAYNVGLNSGKPTTATKYSSTGTGNGETLSHTVTEDGIYVIFAIMVSNDSSSTRTMSLTNLNYIFTTGQVSRGTTDHHIVAAYNAKAGDVLGALFNYGYGHNNYLYVIQVS